MNSKEERLCLDLGTSTLYEASKLNCSVDPAIRPAWDGARVVGTAYPVVCAPGDNLALHLAVEQAPKGSVLVVATSNFVAGYWGEVLSVAAVAAGIHGLVIDGGVRDVDALKKMRFPAFSRGISMRGTIKKTAPSVGKPVLFGGVPVAAGDIVVGDTDGVAIIPAEHFARVLEAAQARADKEAQSMEKLRNGATTVELLGLQEYRQNHGSKHE
ncbi:4-hydroxy-4-methyl-2-oxoglutarate aldolase OS=Castellaniella defragrans OX=75697 GN=HNR28_001887 PE=4 SV=1 [Castellaniella defragrans]